MITRRQFIVGGAASLAGALAGCEGRSTSSAAPAGVYDLCVIGSGFAGTLLALHHAKKRRRTIVVEAGDGRNSLAGTFAFTNVGDVEYPLAASRMIGVGGTSGHWTGIVVRLMPSDLRARTVLGSDVDWPLTYDELEPFYRRAEVALSVRGFPEVEGAEPPRATPYPSESREQCNAPAIALEGRPLTFFPVARSARGPNLGPVRLAETEIRELGDWENVRLLAGYQVRRLVSFDGASVEHIEVGARDGTTHTIRARIFVLAAGVVESARLLLLSRSRWFPQGIGNSHDMVGRYFMEHPAHIASFRVAARQDTSPGFYRSMSLTDGLRAEGLSSCALQVDVSPTDRLAVKVLPEIEPRPDNRITLSSSKRDFFGDPVPAIRFGYSDRDMRTMARGRAAADAVAKAAGARWVRTGEMETFRYHPAGVCRMGFDETAGVVDRWNRVFGIDNLYVSGAAVFPTAGTANPTLTVVALALRLADHLDQRLAV